ncbi:MAG: hypothetical protein ACKV2U_30725 [Bryobacteraceae bacterium]
MKKYMLYIAAIAALTAVNGNAQTTGPLVIDLVTGSIFDLGPATPVRAINSYLMPYATVQTAAVRTCPDTPYQAKVEVNFSPGNAPVLKKARLTVEYDGGPSTRLPNLPTGWTTHIGDDPMNDGFGGGSGLNHVAEAQVLDQNLAVYSSALNPGEVDRVVYQEMRIAKGAVKYEFANQYFSWGQPFNEVDATNGKKLFEIGTAGSDSRVYIGLNRVIRNGSPRIGCGAKRAILEFVP